MTTRELVYMILDEMKTASDDSYFTEEHIMFLLGKHRAALLKQQYSTIKKQIPDSNYQTICLDLIKVPAINGQPCEGGPYLRSKEKLPFLLGIGVNRVYPIDYYQGEITLINRDRMRYVGFNKYLKNIIYCSIGPDNYLYMTSSNPQFLYLQKVRFTGIFEDINMASQFDCIKDSSTQCDPIDTIFPLEESLVSLLIQSVLKELLGATWRPEDQTNNANDDLSNLAAFIAKNTKSDFQKQLDT